MRLRSVVRHSRTHAGLLHRDLVPAEVVGVAEDALLATLSGVDNSVFTWKYLYLKSVLRQQNETNFEFTLVRPGPARRNMCFLWWHSCVKKQWIFTK